MLQSIFNSENVVFKTIAKIGYLWYLNVLWLFCSLPIFTIGASTTALIYSCTKLHNEDGYVTKNFFHSFKENFKQATGIWLIYLAAGAVLAIALIFWNNSDVPFSQIIWAVVLLITIVYLISLMYVFAIQSRFYNTVKNTIKFSFMLAYTNLAETILMGLIFIGVIAINVATNQLVNFITLNSGVSFMYYFLTSHYEKVFKVYVDAATPEEEPDPFEAELQGKDVSDEYRNPSA